MKKKVSIAAGLLLLLALALVFWQAAPTRVERTLDACIYRDGEVVGETAIRIDGETGSRLLSSGQTYTGEFQIGCLEKTCREGASASIDWRGADAQSVSFSLGDELYSGSDFADIEEIRADRQLKDIRVTLSDGTVIWGSQLTSTFSTNSGV
ncbi:MAG: hypothetical protein NC319_06855 [Butyricicoccus sp.]|nr:hypothetical protein [Butyricicoccus sp.]